MPDESEPTRPEIDPLDTIVTFVDANDRLMRMAVLTSDQPSTEAIVTTHQFKRDAIESIAPMINTRFFVSVGDPELIDTATRAVMSTTQKLWDLATELRFDDPTHFNFDDNVHPHVVAALTEKDGGDDEARLAMANTVSMLCNTYESAVQNLFEKVMTADKVVHYSMTVHERARRQRQLLGFCSTALATFIGVGMANYSLEKVDAKLGSRFERSVF